MPPHNQVSLGEYLLKSYDLLVLVVGLTTHAILPFVVVTWILYHLFLG